MAEETERSETNPGQGQGSGEPGSGSDLGRSDESHGPAEVSETPVQGESSEGTQAAVTQNRTALHVKLGVYDGPLDLLLELIKKNEMDIYNIQISVITQQYLDSLAEMKQLDLEVAGEYLVMAATLLYIKSKMLLPQEEGDEDDEGGDPRAELVRKLLEYQAFKEAAKELSVLEQERAQVFTRQISDYYLSTLDPEDVGIDTFSANLFDLLTAFQGVMSKLGRETPHEVFEQIISIEEKMLEIKDRLSREKKIGFVSLFEGGWTRNQLIATFLAVLEIVRNQFAFVVQDKTFGEIMIERRETATAATTEAS